MKSDLTVRFFDPANFQQAWKKVAENNGCAGVDGETIAHFAANVEENLAKLRKAVLTGKYRPLPHLQFFIPKKDKSWRSLAVPTVRDRIVQQALLNVLHPVMEKEFEPASFAYRPDRGHRDAVRQVEIWHDRGYEWVLDGDIVKYFDNVAHPRLLAEVKERLNHPLVLSLVEGWLKAGVLTQYGLILPEKGLPQGAVISPILANVYLDDFDEIIGETNLKLVRYADDFLVLGRSQKQVIQAKEEVDRILQDLGLQLHPEKTQITNFQKGFRFLGQVFAGDLIIPTQPSKESHSISVKPSSSLRLIHADTPSKPTVIEQALLKALKDKQAPIPPPLFVVFGYKVREEKTVKIQSNETIWRSGMSTLYLVNQGAIVRKEGERFEIQVPQQETLKIPIREIERILVYGNILLTPSVISSCLYQKISVIFLTQTGSYKGHLYSAEFGDLQVQEAQFYFHNDPIFQLEIAKAIVGGKLLNSKNYLVKLNRKRKIEEVFTAISGLSEDLAAKEKEDLTLDELRGYEGIGATRYFQALGHLIVNPGFTFTGRNRRPPKDPVNSLLSFGYTLLFNNVLSLIFAEGLNPYLGNLHRSDRKDPFLAFDLMEEFRSPIVDTLVIKLINQKIVRPTDFTWPNAEGGVYLTDSARRIFLKHFEERISEKITHPESQESVSYRRIIQLQIQRYKQALLSEVPYQSFTRVD